MVGTQNSFLDGQQGSELFTSASCGARCSSPKGNGDIERLPTDAAYCYFHWNAVDSEYGFCPHGHGKSLDPDW